VTANSDPAPGWGAQTEMNHLEATIWRAEIDPRLRSGGVVLEVLDQVPDWDRVVRAHEWATHVAPRLRYRVVDDPLHVGPPIWVPTDLDLGYHLSRVSLPADDGIDGVLDIAALLHMCPFDPARPLWQAVLVDGLAGGKGAYLLKFHHSMADGQGTVQLFDLLHSTRRGPTPDKPTPPLAPSENVRPAGLAVRRVRTAILHAPRDMTRMTAGILSRGGQVVSLPETLQSVVGYAQSLARVAAPQAGRPSPLFRHRGMSRRLRTIEIPLSALKRSGQVAGGTINDAYLAGLLGGLGRYHRWHGIEAADIPTALPVSLRSPDHPIGGNRFAAAMIAGPAGESDPSLRIKLVHQRVTRAREEPALDLVGVAAPIASRLPSALLARLAMRMSSGIDLQASNISGLDRPAHLAGARITATYVFGPVPGCAIMATLFSQEGMCYVGIATDNDAVPDPDRLVADLKDGFSEVSSLAESAP